ncbi:MAG: hydantoin utilization protein A [Planctomycetes bacterium]|nr:hydantoin utilization protein A [Planctomycetota bacterium]
MTLFLIACGGVSAGLIHVFMGPDHLAALLPISAGQRWRAWALGVWWGVGHSAGVLVVAAFALILKGRFDLERFGSWGECLVGVALVSLGALGIRKAFHTRLHAHAHAHGGNPHVHLHVHATDTHPVEHGEEGQAHQHRHVPVLLGVTHGLAGAAHLFAVLPAVAMPDFWAAGLYLGAFTLGSVAAMGAFAALVGQATSWAGREKPGVAQGILFGSSAASLAVGALWLALPLLGYRLL